MTVEVADWIVAAAVAAALLAHVVTTLAGVPVLEVELAAPVVAVAVAAQLAVPLLAADYERERMNIQREGVWVSVLVAPLRE